MKRIFLDKILFVKELFENPRLIGSVIPSSKFLAKAIVENIPKESHGYIVELGAGTGAITKGILSAGIDPKRLIIVEISPRLVRFLHEKFPGVKIIEGSAENLDVLLGKDKEKIDVIVSSLPLKSLPKNVVQKIIFQIKKNLSTEGLYIQYTYMLFNGKAEATLEFNKINAKTVWKNIPPATVHVMRKTS